MKTYTLNYRDRLDNLHTVVVKITNGSGSVTIQNGEVSPLVIQEDDNDDMLSPVRTRTGYLSIIEPNFGDYADLFPTSPKSHIIETSDGFNGYLQPQAFANGWEAGPRTLRIPVASPLNLMDNTKSLAVDYTIRYRILDMLSDAIAKLGYEKVILPRGLDNESGIIFSFVSSLTVSPFAEQDDFQYDANAPLYAPRMVSEVLEEIAKRFGMIIHDYSQAPSGIGYGILIFVKPDYDGPYQLWDEEDLDQEVPPSDLTVTGATVRNFGDYFTVASDDNDDSIIQPYSRITFNNEGEQAQDEAWHPERSHYTGFDIPRNYTNYMHCMLQPVGGWLTSAYLSTSGISGVVALCGIYNKAEQQEADAEEYILASMPSGTVQDTEMFIVKMPGAQIRDYRISGKMKVFPNGGSSYVVPTDGNGNFGIAMKYGNYYWDWSEDEEGWQTNPQQKILTVTPSATDGTFITPWVYRPDSNLQESYYEVVFYYDTARGFNYDKIFTGITLQTYNFKATRKYIMQNPNQPIVVDGSSGGMSDAEVDLLFSRNMNSNYLTQVGGSFNSVNSDYVLHPQRLRKVTVVRSGVFDYTHYLCKWSFSDGWTWRLIAVSDDIANCERTLTFLGSQYF